VAGEIVDSSRKSILKSIQTADVLEKDEVMTGALVASGFV